MELDDPDLKAATWGSGEWTARLEGSGFRAVSGFGGFAGSGVLESL